MSFDFPGFFRFIGKWALHGGFSTRRLAILLACLILLPLLLLVNWVSLLLDRVLYPDARRQPVDEPVFIIGNFRSGTTRLHRLLASDPARYSTTTLLDVLFAPAVLQKRLFALLGRPLSRLSAWLERQWRQSNVMHEVSLLQPEEDEYFCLHIWSALTIGLSSGLLDEAKPYARFDHDIDVRKRRRIMRFYRACVERQLFNAVRRRSHDSIAPIYLAKNPAASPKIASLVETFPDCRIIYLVRSPLEAVPSFISMMAFSWRAVGLDDSYDELRDFILEMAGHWYRYPLEQLALLPTERHSIVKYEDLVHSPEAVVRDLYGRFGIEVNEAFAQVLQAAQAEAASYESRHAYDAASFGLSDAHIVAAFEDVFERFGFATVRAA